MTILLILIASTSASLVYIGEDWPQWNGPRREGTVHEKGLLEIIPADGLTVCWRQPVLFGYSRPMIADCKAFLFDYQKVTGGITNNAGKRDEQTGKERLLCFDSASERPL